MAFAFVFYYDDLCSSPDEVFNIFRVDIRWKFKKRTSMANF